MVLCFAERQRWIRLNIRAFQPAHLYIYSLFLLTLSVQHRTDRDMQFS